jgi:hypothetical protein
MVTRPPVERSKTSMFSRSGAAGAGAVVCAKAGDTAKAKMPDKSNRSFETKERRDINEVPLKTE